MNENNNGNGSGTKEVDRRVVNRSYRKQRQLPTGSNPAPQTLSNESQIFWFMAQRADEILQWGTDIKTRDKQLRNLLTKENIWLSALSVVASRNASFSWKLTGPDRTTARSHNLLEEVEFGDGWETLIVKTSMDLYTQDNGAFWGLARQDNRDARSPVIGIYHLDSGRCWRTGNKFAPVIYQDIENNYHLLRWWNVCLFSEMPCGIEGLDGIQYSAFTRLLEALRVRRNILVYDNERTSGRNNQQIHMVKGITTQQLNDAIAGVRARDDSAGLLRYANPVVVGVLDPKADVGHDTIDLRSMPEDYDSEEYFKEYMTQVSMALLSDYQEFSPLPGGNLGTSNQSSILHLKSRGKGAGLFRKMIRNNINLKILPSNVQLDWDDPDYDAEKTEAEVEFIRARSRAARIKSLEITPAVARQIANDQGDLRQEYLVMMGDEDITQTTVLQEGSTPKSQVVKPENIQVDLSPEDMAAQRAQQAAQRNQQNQQDQPGERFRTP